MGSNFVTDNNEEKIVSIMGSGRCRIFVGITNGLSEAFGKPHCITSNGIDYVIHEGDFCALVEFVFTEYPNSMLIGWAEEAAGIYQTIKGQLYDWHWNGMLPASISTLSQTPPAFQPVNIGDLWPTKHSGKEIGRSRPK